MCMQIYMYICTCMFEWASNPLNGLGINDLHNVKIVTNLNELSSSASTGTPKAFNNLSL